MRTRPAAPVPAPHPTVSSAEGIVTDLLLRPLADAFMLVGLPVAVLVTLTGLAQVRWGGQMQAWLLRRARFGPLIGAVLGVTPGCGLAIAVMPLYVGGSVSFGTALAALTATMGDASFVLIAADPRAALLVHALLLVVGVTTGYAVDALGIDPRRRLVRAPRRARTSPGRSATPSPTGPSTGPPTPSPAGGARRAGAPSPVQTVEPTVPHPRLPVGAPTASLLALSLPALVVATPTTLGLSTPLPGDFDPYLALGVAGAVIAIAVLVHDGPSLADDDAQAPASSAAALRHAGHEAAFVTAWVAVAFTGWALLSTLLALDAATLPLAGLVGVLIGAAVGLIPGCALQIVLVGLWTTGGLPAPALVANAVSQDGDALLPLLALDRRAAVVATCVTTVPAVLAGSLVLLLL